MTIRHAACTCGQLQVVCEGDPPRISMCHCLACQQRSGSVFSCQAWFKREQITTILGDTTTFTRVTDAGNSAVYRFCPVCGTTLFWEAEKVFPGMMAVAVGAFADPNFPPPGHSVWERRRHAWVAELCDVAARHFE